MNKSIFLALAALVALMIWMGSGNINLTESVTESENKDAKQPMKVTVLDSVETTVKRYVTIQGQVEANRSVDIKVEVDGRISELPVQEGQRIVKGVSILTLSADYRLKQLAQAKAVLRQRYSDLSATNKLKKRGLIAENRIIADQVAVQTARAELAIIRHEVDNAKVLAPFDGVLNSRAVEMGDFIQKGDVIGRLIDDKKIKVTGQVPQRNVGDLTLNQGVEIRLSNGFSVFGDLAYISRVADPVTRSYRVEVSLDNSQLKRLIGLTTSLKLPLGTEKGHFLPNSVLGLGVNGDLEVKIIDSENKVSTVSVSIIRTAKEGFWLNGLDDNVIVITQGKDFVSEGETVDPVKLKADSEIASQGNS